MNYLENVTHLRNEYFGLRHGARKMPNLIISSAQKYDDQAYDITDEGYQQVVQSVIQMQFAGLLDKYTIIRTSKFLRARSSAEAAREILDAKKAEEDYRLGERWFGRHLEGSNIQNYSNVWKMDERDPFHRWDEMESVMNVLARTTELICECEQMYSMESILLVSHGDVLNILETAFNKISCSKHRSGVPFELGEIRRLIFKGGEL